MKTFEQILIVLLRILDDKTRSSSKHAIKFEF